MEQADVTAVQVSREHTCTGNPACVRLSPSVEKDKAFAVGVDRNIITKGAVMLDVEVRDLVEDVIAGMREVADAIGLAGVDAEAT